MLKSIFYECYKIAFDNLGERKSILAEIVFKEKQHAIAVDIDYWVTPKKFPHILRFTSYWHFDNMTFWIDVCFTELFHFVILEWEVY